MPSRGMWIISTGRVGSVAYNASAHAALDGSKAGRMGSGGLFSYLEGNLW
jgi:hypothetical protein